MESFNKQMDINEAVLSQIPEGDKRKKALDLLQQLHELIAEQSKPKEEPTCVKEDRESHELISEQGPPQEDPGCVKEEPNSSDTSKKRRFQKVKVDESIKQQHFQAKEVDKDKPSQSKTPHKAFPPSRPITRYCQKLLTLPCTKDKDTVKLRQAKTCVKVSKKKTPDSTSNFKSRSKSRRKTTRKNTAIVASETSKKERQGIERNGESSHTTNIKNVEADSLSVEKSTEIQIEETNGEKEMYEKRDGSWWCLICGRKVNSRANVKVHIRTHTGEKPYTCPTCQRQFTVKVNYTRHLARHQQELPHACLHCNKKYAEERHLRQHVKAKHPKDPITGKIKAPDIKGRVCDECGKTFSNPYYLKVHLRVHNEERPLECEFCGRRFRSISNLRYHLNHVHRDKVAQLPFACSHCSSRFLSQGRLNRHTKMYHTGPPNERSRPEGFHTTGIYNCCDCEETFSSRYKLMVHKRESHGQFFECDRCSQRFVWRYLLVEHQQSVHARGGPRFSCTLCAQSFSRKAMLKKHQAVHGVTEPYKCKECDREYQYLSSLRLHQRCHHNHSSAPHVCTQCGRSFALAAGLKRHLAYHGGQRVHTCDLCSKGFVVKGDLQRHRKTHDKALQMKPNEEIENQQNVQNLLYKQRTTSQELGAKDLNCNLCNISFPDISSKRSHDQMCELSKNTATSRVIMNPVIMDDSDIKMDIMLLQGEDGTQPVYVSTENLAGGSYQGELDENKPISSSQVGEVADALVTLSGTSKAGRSSEPDIDPVMSPPLTEAQHKSSEINPPAESIISVSSSSVGQLRCSKCHTTFANEYSINKHAKFCVGTKGSSVLNSILLPNPTSGVIGNQLATSSAAQVNVIKPVLSFTEPGQKLLLVQPPTDDNAQPVYIAIDDALGLVQSGEVTEVRGKELVEAPPTLIAQVGEIASALVSLSASSVSDGSLSEEIVVSGIQEDAVILQTIQEQQDVTIKEEVL